MAPTGTIDDTSAAEDGVDAVDGRRRRREQNRDAVIDTLITCFSEGIYQPSTAELARRSGISHRSLFRYFDDVDDLSRAAVERQLASARHLYDFDLSPDAPTDVKIRTIVTARLTLFEAIAPGARAGRACGWKNPVVAEQLHESRVLLRAQIRRLFAPELVSRPGVLAAVDVLLSFESRELLCGEQGLGRARATSVLVDALTTLLVP